jgi:lambda family phage portal protein
MGVLDKLFRRLAPRLRTRTLDAGAGGRRWIGASTTGPLNAEIGAHAATISRRAAWMARNDAWAANGVTALVSALVGTGVKPQSQAADAATCAALHARWASWTDDADADGRCDLYGLQSLACRALIESGECFAQLSMAETGLQVRLLDSEMLPLSETRELGDGRRILQGVEFTADGRRAAYHVHKYRPEVPAFSSELVRVPADQMLHLARLEVPGQVRGLSWLTPVMLRLHDLHSTQDAQLQRQLIAALFAGFIKRPEPGSGLLGETAANPEPVLEPGTISYLADGEDITFPQTPDAGGVIDFLKLQLRAVAAGLGVPAYLLDSDLSQANYSSLRAALIEFRTRVEALQHQVLVFQFLRPVWRAFVLAEVLAGRLAGDLGELLAVEWITPATPYVDPAKDAAAAAELLSQGLTSRRKIVASLGYDVEALDAEIAADRDRARGLNLAFPFPAPPSATPSPTPSPVRPIGGKNAA